MKKLLFVFLLLACSTSSEEEVFNEETVRDIFESDTYSITSVELFEKQDEPPTSLFVNTEFIVVLTVANENEEAEFILNKFDRSLQDEKDLYNELSGGVIWTDITFPPVVSVNDSIARYRDINNDLMIFSNLPIEGTIREAVLDSFIAY